MHLMALGMFLFEIGSLPFDELQRRMDWRHAANSRFGARDAQQFVGPGEDRVTLSGTAWAEMLTEATPVETLREMAAEGEAWPLVDGSGRVYGSYVITALDIRNTWFTDDGTPRKIDFGIDLLAVDDPAESGAGA